MDAAHDVPVLISPELKAESGDHQDEGRDKAKNATTEDASCEERPGDESNESKNDQQKTAAGPMDLESEIHDLKAKLAELVTSQDQVKERDYDDPFTMLAEHKFDLQRRRYSEDSSDSDSDSDDYTQFDHRRRRMERVLVRELKDLRREKEMIKDIRLLRKDRDTLVEKEREWRRNAVNSKGFESS
ncbi:putative aaa family atpase protein [Phaeoacremonium minimum UCRPA7]|uniref:Putative aaa family atpase protein n=1 Tax=Phaeoacremonium minimum (strain UCR-PA7) TaxID=1286976 RepID=R8BI55_PHAM7|nr:putative aaa family atpase protein [Phaeoacremonium minimum UCRPA7]EON98991.1 putative aaa family atpase protein [Phaeoacremonium minimum UCRPA7]